MNGQASNNLPTCPWVPNGLVTPPPILCTWFLSMWCVGFFRNASMEKNCGRVEFQPRLTWLWMQSNGDVVKIFCKVCREAYSNSRPGTSVNFNEARKDIFGWNLLCRFYHRIFGKIKCNYPDYLFQSTF